jgi:UPF0755 protein
MQNRNDIELQPINGQPSGLNYYKKPKLPKIAFRAVIAFGAVILFVAVAFLFWMNVQLSPRDAESNELVSTTIEFGSTSFEIADRLEAESIIRSSTAFNMYVRYIGKNNNLQAGNYVFSSSESVQQIVDRMISGDVEQITITFYPGATLVDNSTNDEAKKHDVTTVLKRAGYSESEIALALNKSYDSPVFFDKPVDADLEGYIYGETYNFNSNVKVEDVIKTAIDELYSVVEEYNLIEAFSERGLSLYEGITLASIIQREATIPEDQKQIAQVFYSRLDLGMSLGADVTYQYIADKLGVARDLNLDSPYNTRRFTGLPPGPIAAPGLSALLAVAEPAEGDYLFFLAGDDQIVRFTRTQAEHDRNIVNYCQITCSKL